MVNLVAKRLYYQKLIVKLLVKNADKVSVSEMDKIEKWAKENDLKIIKLKAPLNGDQIKNIINETLAEIVELIDNNGYDKTLD